MAVLPGNPPALHPYLPATELDRQIVDLVHEPLIRVGVDGQFTPALAERWDWSQTVTCWFVKEETAKKAQEHLKAISADRWIEWGLDALSTKGNELALRFSKISREGPETAMLEVTKFEPLPVQVLRVTLREQARQFHEHFMGNAVEAAQVKRVWYDGQNSFDLVVSGNTTKFLEELTNYYQPKTNLEPRIQVVDEMPALAEPALDFVLREGLRWHDGPPVTPEDVRVTFEAVMSQPWPVPNREALRQVQSIETPGGGKVRVLYRRRFGPAVCGWVNLPILPAHWLREQTLDAEGRVFTTSTPPGAGVLTITSRDLRALALEPFAGRAEPFRLGRLTFSSGTSTFSTRLGFATGSVDMFWPEEAEVGALQKERALAVRAMPPRSRLLVLWNLRSPVLGDVRVRSALAQATDRQALIRDLLSGRGRVEEGLFQPGLWFAKKQSVTAFDADAAYAKLAAAGWLRDVNGIARRPGETLAFELLTTAGNPMREKLAKMLAEQWRRLGAEVRVTPVSWEELVDGRLSAHRFDAAILGLDFETSWDQHPLWHSSQAEYGLNFAGLADRQIDLLLEDLRGEFDPARVAEKAGEMESLLLAQHPMLPLFTDMTQVALRLKALPEGAKAADLTPWTLRDLVLKPAAAATTEPKIEMRKPDL
jgi:peptide/nickel transport system substrate-binding protein